VQQVQITLTEGTIIQNRYVVESLLGKGGFGAVYLVRDMRVRSNLFALKEVIDPSKQDHKRFLFEGEVLKQLAHPALPRVYRVFENDEEKRVYLLLDYIEGPNLEQLRQLQPGKRFQLSEALHIMAPIMDAIAYLHNQQPPIMHRDVKPSNIIVPEKGDEPVLVDFCIAKLYNPESTTTVVRHASPGYGAPEQYSQGTNTRTDIYGLGATFYALLAGEVPVDAYIRMAALSSSGKDPLEPVDAHVPGIPRYVVDAIQKAMAINSQDRFDRVEQFWLGLNARPMRQQSPSVVAAVAVPVLLSSGPMNGEAVHEGAASGVENKTMLPRQDLATLAAPGIVQARPSRRRIGKWLPFLLVPLVLLVGLAIGADFWAYLAGRTAPTASAPAHGHHAASPTATHKTIPTATPTAHPSPTPTPTPAPVVVPPTPTPIPVVYPNVAGAYSGNIHNTTANISTTMSLSIQQNGSVISGYFTVSSPLQGSNPFTGTVTTGRNIQFTVQSYHGNAPLFFWGYIQSNNSMSGEYCSLDSSGQCSSSAGAGGTWSVFHS
jgi:eukaryotic-like serine/threonine-protein kinase